MSSLPARIAKDAPPHRTTIYSLPDEILTSIINLVDLPTSLSTARVSRKFNTCSEPRIWRDVDLSVLHPDTPSDPVERILARFKPYEAGKRERLANQPNAKAIHIASIEAKVETIILRMEGRRGPLIQHLKVVPTGATAGMMSVMRAATGLKSLQIDRPDVDEPQWQEELADRETLDYFILRGNLHFPALTHLVIHPCSVKFWEILPSLCNAAPSLSHLSLFWDLETSVQATFGITPPTYVRMTKIKHLRMTFGDPAVPISTTSRFFDIIRQSPELLQFSVLYDPNGTPDERAVYAALVSALEACQELEDLFWDSEVEGLRDQLDKLPDPAKGTAFGQLRRLVYKGVEWDSIFDHIPRLPNLTTLYLDREDIQDEEEDEDDEYDDWDDEEEDEAEDGDGYTAREPPFDLRAAPSTLRPPITDPVQSMLPEFADRLRGAPNLRLILARPDEMEDDSFDNFTRLDEFERVGKYVIGHINSLCRAGQEVLDARLFLPFVQETDIPTPPTPAVLSHFDFQRDDIRRIAYTARDGTPRTRVFTRLFRPNWLNYTDFEGKVVPMEVLEEMRKVEGKSKEEWEGRGIDVGDEAWAVLEKWTAMDV